jgi:dipeptidyl aminopeptidase/acylaminoacyl peptidase
LNFIDNPTNLPGTLMKISSTFVYISLLASLAIFVCYASFLHNNVPLIPRKVLFGNPEKTYPQLSPDGTQIAYLAPHNGVLNIWVKTFDKNDDIVITHEPKRGIHDFSWAPNGQLLYFKDNDGDENYHLYSVNSSSGETKDITAFPGVKVGILDSNQKHPNELLIEMNKDNPKFFDVYHLDLTTAQLTLVAKNPGIMTRWIAGDHLQVLGALQTNEDGSQTLLVRDNNKDQWRTLLTLDFEDLLEDELYSGILGFSRDDAYLFLNTSLGTNTRCFQKINVKTGERTIIAHDDEFDVNHVIFNSITGDPDFVCFNKQRKVYQVLNPALQDDFNRICALSNGDIYTIIRSNDDTKWLVCFIHDIKSTEYYIYDCTTKKASLLFYQRPELNNYPLAPMEPISFTSRDGLKIHGYITFPIGVARTNLPLVLCVHGGPFYRDSWGYVIEPQLIANRGCICLQVNFRGSSGYGKAFLAAGNREWGNKMHNDLVDAIKWALDQKIADPKKIAIYGASYGGYAALVGATFTPDLFCCAIDYCGPSNLTTLLKALPPYWSLAQWQKRIGNLADEEFLKSRSPLYKIDQLKIPLLIAHGGNDVRVIQAESEQFINALKEKNISYEYLLFPDEGHGFVRPENRLQFYAAFEQFLAKHLGCRCEQ